MNESIGFIASNHEQGRPNDNVEHELLELAASGLQMFNERVVNDECVKQLQHEQHLHEEVPFMLLIEE